MRYTDFIEPSLLSRVGKLVAEEGGRGFEVPSSL